MKVISNPQWKDTGNQKEPVDDDNIRVPRLEVDDATTYIDKDGSDNMTFTDAVTNTKTLAELAAGGGGGDVTGPASSTDNEIVRQHSTTGKILQTYTSNPPTISDTGDVNIDGNLDVENIIATEMVLTPKSSSASTVEGTMFYDSDDNSIWVATE